MLDVNALIAALFSAHEHHPRVSIWVSSQPAEDTLATCSITELGFVRVLNLSPQYRVGIKDSKATLAAFRRKTIRRVDFLHDGTGACELPDWVKSGKQVTDGHLIELASANDAELATLDVRIPRSISNPMNNRNPSGQQTSHPEGPEPQPEKNSARFRTCSSSPG